MLVFSIVAEYFGRGLFSTPAPPVNIQKQVGPLFSDLKRHFQVGPLFSDIKDIFILIR